MDLEVDFGGVGEDLLKGVRLQLSLHDLVTVVLCSGLGVTPCIDIVYCCFFYVFLFSLLFYMFFFF